MQRVGGEVAFARNFGDRPETSHPLGGFSAKLPESFKAAAADEVMRRVKNMKDSQRLAQRERESPRVNSQAQ